MRFHSADPGCACWSAGFEGSEVQNVDGLSRPEYWTCVTISGPSRLMGGFGLLGDVTKFVVVLVDLPLGVFRLGFEGRWRFGFGFTDGRLGGGLGGGLGM